MVVKRNPPLILEYSEHGSISTNKQYKCLDDRYKGTPFTQFLKITKDMGFARSKPYAWVSVENTGIGWSKPITGLFTANLKKSVYKGDYRKGKKKTNLLLFQFIDGGILKIHFYNYYTTRPKKLIESILKTA